MKVLVIGGHVTPALAVIDELDKRKQEISFVGRRFANEREKQDSFEYKEVTARKIPFYEMNSGRMQSSLSAQTFLQIWLFIKAFLQSFKVLNKIKPDVVMSFGGYIAFPICLAAFIKGIKIITHEQTLVPGTTNRIIARFAKVVCVSFPESAVYFKNKAVVVGNPIRPELFNEGNPLIDHINKPLVYISGGSLGSHSINVLIEKNLPELLKDFIIIHQTGNIKEYNDFERLSSKQSDSYIVREHISSSELAWIFNKADVCVSRSGANTVFELMAFKKPAVLIPLPWAAHDEQNKQAQLLYKQGVVEIFSQDEDPSKLPQAIHKVYSQKNTYKEHYISLSSYIHNDAAEKITDIILAR
jgi:UDP-N-acetylglucosamine--N-acetylmuramyl-(pentapeptide) pyrophosphoryl-undecaprenol N-acetylglucosamine transferase